MTRSEPDRAFDECTRIARDHYENFPVASVLLPPGLRQPIAAIYAFARSADDFADEHDWDDSTRLRLLGSYRTHLDALRHGDAPTLPTFTALGEAIRRHNLPFAPFFDLLDAFEQDVRKKRYADFNEVLEYCRRSANPVGRLLLCLFDRDTPANRACSDAVCTALQLINFLQDVRVDLARGRLYLPQDEMALFGVEERHIHEAIADAGWRSLIDAQIERIDGLLRVGAPLGRVLPGRMGLEIRMTIAGGRAVLDKIRTNNRRGFIGGERLSKWDWIRLAPPVLLGLRA